MEEEKMSEKSEKQFENPILITIQQRIEKLTEEIKLELGKTEPNLILVNKEIVALIQEETKFHNIKELYLEENQEQIKTELNSEEKEQPKSLEERIAMTEKEAEECEPTEDEITEKRDAFLEEINEDQGDGWTDATQSDAGTLGEDGMVVLDDDMLDQFLGKYNKEESDDDENGEDEEEEEENVDFDELEKEFVTGKESDEDYLFGKHGDKFCVSVGSVLEEGLVISGGGDDQLQFYKFELPKEIESHKNESEMKEETEEGQKVTEKSKPIMIEPFKIVPHHETIDIIDLSYDFENVFSLTEKELMCTNLKTLETQKLEIDTPTQFTCHKQGGVFAIANAFNVEIFNIKGFKFYDSFCLDEEVNLLRWTLNGKQLVAACDNKLRIITPKTQEVTKVSSTVRFHEGEITTISMLENTIFTGCIDGYVFATNLTKGTVITGTKKLETTINTLCAADNYLIVGPAKNSILWFDSNKMKQLFSNELNGASTDIIQLQNKNQYAVGDIEGEIRMFDKRSPMQQKFLLKAGNTVHKLWNEENLLLTACEDGCVRGWDLRKYQY